MNMGLNVHAIRAIYLYRDGANPAHGGAERRLAGAVDLALFRGVRRGDRLAHVGSRRRQLWRLHRARPDHAAVLTQSMSNASFGIYFPRFVGTIYEIAVGAGFCRRDRDRLCRRGGDQIDHDRPDHAGHGALCSCSFASTHPFWMLGFLLLTAITFSLFGFIIGIWADGFEKLQIIPLLIITPLTFLGGSFYSIDMLPPFWRSPDAVQSGRLSGQRLSLEFLQRIRCQRRDQPRHDAGVPGRMPGDCRLDIQDGLSAEDVNGAAYLLLPPAGEGGRRSRPDEGSRAKRDGFEPIHLAPPAMTADEQRWKALWMSETPASSSRVERNSATFKAVALRATTPHPSCFA